MQLLLKKLIILGIPARNGKTVFLRFIIGSSVHNHCQFSQAFMSVDGDRCLEVLGVKLVCDQSVQFDVSFES